MKERQFRQEMRTDPLAIETANILLSINCASFRFDPPFTYTNGLKSPIYLDNRIIMSHPDERTRIVELYTQIMQEHIGLDNVACVSGTASAALPQAALLAGSLDVPMVFVRPSSKLYGKENKLEGYLQKGMKVVIIEDHISTGISAANNAKTIMDNGGQVEYCIATTTYETAQSEEILDKLGIKLFTLSTGRTIIEEAKKQGRVSDVEYQTVLEWFHDPEGWTKLH